MHAILIMSFPALFVARVISRREMTHREISLQDGRFAMLEFTHESFVSTEKLSVIIKLT